MFRKSVDEGERTGGSSALERCFEGVPGGGQVAGVNRRTVTKSAALAATMLLAGGGIAQAQPGKARTAKDLTVRLPAADRATPDRGHHAVSGRSRQA